MFICLAHRIPAEFESLEVHQNYLTLHSLSEDASQMIKVQCCVCSTEFDIYPSRYELSKYKVFFCKRACKDAAQVKPEEDRREAKLACNRRAKDKKYAKRRAMLDEEKMKRGCVDCGYNKHPAALEFDHRNPSEKKFSIGAGWNRGLDQLLKEIAKCDVRCGNCHAIKTAEARHGVIAKKPRRALRWVYSRISEIAST